jgi:hypothetical protein
MEVRQVKHSALQESTARQTAPCVKLTWSRNTIGFLQCTHVSCCTVGRCFGLSHAGFPPALHGKYGRSIAFGCRGSSRKPSCTSSFADPAVSSSSESSSDSGFTGSASSSSSPSSASSSGRGSPSAAAGSAALDCALDSSVSAAASAARGRLESSGVLEAADAAPAALPVEALRLLLVGCDMPRTGCGWNTECDGAQTSGQVEGLPCVNSRGDAIGCVDGSDDSMRLECMREG